jgi:hypothetical protein
MTSLARRVASFGIIIVVASSGCNALGLTNGPRLAGLRDLNENPHFRDQTLKQEACPQCGESECICENKRYAIDWYEERSDRPIGSRQQYRMGKVWPPFARPVGPNAELSARFHASHYWPHPYNCQDREYLKTAIHAQEKNGWIEEATLYDYHFDPETNELTRPGRLHLRWILLHVPDEFRVAWVQSTIDADASRTRIGSVRETAVTLVGEEKIPPIMMRVTTPTGASAEEAVSIRRAWLSSMPEPRISYEASSSGVGG